MSDLLRVDLGVVVERAAMARLLRKYADRPMSLADACLVRLAELNDGASVLTIDRAQDGVPELGDPPAAACGSAAT